MEGEESWCAAVPERLKKVVYAFLVIIVLHNNTDDLCVG